MVDDRLVEAVEEGIRKAKGVPLIEKKGPKAYFVSLDEPYSYYSAADDSATISAVSVDVLSEYVASKLNDLGFSASKYDVAELVSFVITAHEAGHKIFDAVGFTDYVRKRLRSKGADVEPIAVRLANAFHDVTVNLFAAATLLESSALSFLRYLGLGEEYAKAVGQVINALTDASILVTPKTLVDFVIEESQMLGIVLDDPEKTRHDLESTIEQVMSGPFSLWRLHYKLFDEFFKHVVGITQVQSRPKSTNIPNIFGDDVKGEGGGEAQEQEGEEEERKGGAEGEEGEEEEQEGERRAAAEEGEEEGEEGKEEVGGSQGKIAVHGKSSGSVLDKLASSKLKGRRKQSKGAGTDASPNEFLNVNLGLKKRSLLTSLVEEFVWSAPREEEEYTYAKVSKQELALKRYAVSKGLYNAYRSKLLAEDEAPGKPVLIMILDVSPSMADIVNEVVNEAYTLLNTVEAKVYAVLFSSRAALLEIDTEYDDEAEIRKAFEEALEEAASLGTDPTIAISLINKAVDSFESPAVNVLVVSDFEFPVDGKTVAEELVKVLEAKGVEEAVFFNVYAAPGDAQTFHEFVKTVRRRFSTANYVMVTDPNSEDVALEPYGG